MADGQTPAEGTIRVLTIDEILAAKDVQEETVEVPQWGGAVKVAGFTKARQQEMRKEATVAGEVDGDRLEMFMFIEGVIDPKFTRDHYEQLRNKSAGAVDTVLRVILKMSGVYVPTQAAATAGDKSSVDEATRSFPAG